MLTTWQKTLTPPVFPELTGSAEFDVAIIGGGLAGILTAYRLAPTGYKVAILEKNTVGSDTTAQTTAFITKDIDTELTDLSKMFGRRKAKAIWGAGQDAVLEYEKIVKEENIDCEFVRCSAYIFAPDEKSFNLLIKEQQTAKTLGITASLSKRNSLGFKYFGYWEIPGQAKFHPLKFLYKLSERVDQRGVKIYNHSEVVDISGKGPFTVRTRQARLSAKSVIIATYDPFSNPLPTKFKKGMYNSYVHEFRIPKGRLKAAIYWDTNNPYNYFRVDAQKTFDRLILGGADHRAELPVSREKNFSAMLNYAKKIFPFRQLRIVNQWVGPILEPSDGLPLIGKFATNKYVVSAFSGNGMTYSVIASQIIADLLAKQPNRLSGIFDPRRVPTFKQLLTKGRDYSEQLFKGAIKNSIQNL